MSVARTARRRHKQMLMNNAQWPGRCVSRPYGHFNKVAGRQEVAAVKKGKK